MVKKNARLEASRFSIRCWAVGAERKVLFRVVVVFCFPWDVWGARVWSKVAFERGEEKKQAQESTMFWGHIYFP